MALLRDLCVFLSSDFDELACHIHRPCNRTNIGKTISKFTINSNLYKYILFTPSFDFHLP